MHGGTGIGVWGIMEVKEVLGEPFFELRIILTPK
jgi:hypothetical protein